MINKIIRTDKSFITEEIIKEAESANKRTKINTINLLYYTLGNIGYTTIKKETFKAFVIIPKEQTFIFFQPLK